MVFTSLPLYLDPPNWHQQQQPGPGGDHSCTENPDQVSAPPPPAGGGGGATTGLIRAGSMTDRARMAKIPQPEAGLKCPRCESTNTKFCYFNNYNLSQPRHFCKTCRRYWTRGGALRNVPVGGGCRRNKRTKTTNRSKSPVGEHRLATTTGVGSISTTAAVSISISPQSSSHLPFLSSSLHNLSDFGLNLGLIPPPPGGGGISRGGVEVEGDIQFQGLHHQNSQLQFPFLSNMEQQQSSVLYTFEPLTETTAVESTRYNLAGIGSSGQLGFPKLQMENDGIGGNIKGLNLSKNFQFWPIGGGNNNIHAAWAGSDLV